MCKMLNTTFGISETHMDMSQAVFPPANRITSNFSLFASFVKLFIYFIYITSHTT